MTKDVQHIYNLYLQHDEMLEGSGKVIALPRKISPSGEALLDDIAALLEMPMARPVIERILREALSDIAAHLLDSA